jgi:peptidoglycan/LPS O-acetylase OafA/YrhL
MYQHLPSPVKFREDINGLRAWAVIAVLLFHFSLIGLPGGFAGVDVFFVISGYLMTAIIVGGYEKGNFSIWKFYMARARRILPALLTVIAVLLVLGWFWLPTPDYQALGAQSPYGMSFLSNIYYWRSAGYFDSAAEEKWLLHTWSLAVEAQFYLLYPIFIALIWKFWKSLKAVTIGVLILFIASLALNLIMSNWKPTAAFYLLPTRGWELAAGALVFLIAKQYQLPKKPLSMLFWTGWIMVIGSFFLIDETFVWPGYWAVLPVLGTSLIILAYKEDCFLTNNAVAQWLGDRSYSLYLWHWPLVVALYFASLQNDWTWVIGFFALSVVLAHFSYQLIETPTRKYLSQAKLLKEVLVIAGFGALIGISAVAIKYLNLDRSFPAQINKIVEEKDNTFDRKDECISVSDKTGVPVDCFYKNIDESKLGVVSIGDSHNDALFTSLGTAALNKGENALYWGKSTCPMILNSEHYPIRPTSCEDFNRAALTRLSEYPNIPVVLAARWTIAIKHRNENNQVPGQQFKTGINSAEYLNFEDSGFLNAFEKQLSHTVCEISKNNPVFLVRPIPEMGVDVPNKLARQIMFGNGTEEVKITLNEYLKRNKEVWDAQDIAAKNCGAKILNPLPYLCDDKFCYGSRDGRPLYYDDDHLSEYGNKFLVPMFEEVFKSNPKN